MRKWKQIGLFLIICCSLGKANEEWASPPFNEPDPLDNTTIKSWRYRDDLKITIIEFYEEVEKNVTIAAFNYMGDVKPEIKKFEDKKESNANLGAEFVRNEKKQWEVVITKQQDYENPVMRTYTMTIGIESISATYKIKIVIINIDDNPPVIQANERNCSIEENYEGPTNCTFTITDVDGWIDQTTFDITSSPSSGTGHFSLAPKRIAGTQYEMRAILHTIKSLDFENIAVYTLGITAKDTAQNPSDILLRVIKVIDMPDMPPVWTNLTSAITISEKSINTLSVTAIDGDYEINAAIGYKISVFEESHGKFFEVVKDTGEIRINEIDRDALKKEIFKFTIIAYEIDNVTSSINSTIVVVVNDLNDHSPEISPSDLSISIREETYMNLEFSEDIVIADPDLAENAQYDVKLVDDQKYNWSTAFLIIPNSGYQLGKFTISVVNAKLLDYEDENWRNINLKIIATERADPSHIGTREVKINLLNWNDELPIFENDNMKVNILENVTLGHHVATVFATDRDVGDTVTHSLVTQRGLQIDKQTGKITTTEDKSFDYESMPIVLVQVVATDNGNNKTYATLTINVFDVNDKPPSLFLPQVKPTIQEEVDIGTKVNTKIYAKDPDTEGLLVFSIDWDSSTAYKSSSPVDESLYRGSLIIDTTYPDGKKNNADAVLIVKKRIDYESFDTMYLTIVVTDMTTVQNANSTSASLTLIINDINDNAPKFDDISEMRIQENQKNNILIGRVTAHDIDGPGNNEVSYSIKPFNDTEDGLVYIDPKRGDIKVDKDGGIDAEVYEYLYYNVNATDGLHNTTLPIEIYVIDENDEYPAADPSKFESTIHIRERSENGTEIVQVYAFDKDRTSPFNNVSYLINTDYPELLEYFSIDKYNGWLKVNLIDDSILDRDRGPSRYSVYLRLRDNFIDEIRSDSKMNTSMITVVLDDINNKIPELPKLSNPAQAISENTVKNFSILTITAEDQDDPETDNTKVFYEIKEVYRIDNQTESLPKNCPILFKVETLEQRHAKISTNCHLKGHYGIWALKLYVQDLGTDPGPLNDTKIYNIKITDFNYHDPVIVYPIDVKVIRLNQNQTINSQLITYDAQLLENFKATDVDYGESGVVTFSITGEAELFQIVSLGDNTAQLHLKSLPNYDEKHTFDLLITATDNGQPRQRSKTQSQKVIFVSTEGPEFTPNTFTARFHENSTGLQNFTIIPEAKDMINEGIQGDVDIFYFLASEDGDMSYFSLDKKTRNLTLRKELDREKQETMSLLVIATTNSNGPNSAPREKAQLNVTVIVVDVNDNPPIFENKTYFGGVALEDAVGKLILTVKATDADSDDSLSYSIIEESLTTSDKSIEGIPAAFEIKSNNGEILLAFKPTSYMTGYFSLDILVQDEVLHQDKAHVKVYMLARDNRVAFTFRNKITILNEHKSFIIKVFSDSFGYICNIDYIEKSNYARAVEEEITTITVHFINEENNLPVSANEIILKSNDLETITNLKANLLPQKLYLVDIPTAQTSNDTEELHDVVQWVLVCLTTFFFILSVALLVAYIIRIRGLTERLDKLAITNYGDEDPGVIKIGVMPNSNKFALEGSNPMWKTESVNEIDDNISRGSGDSDLIGVENNPDFDYEQKWKSENKVKLNTISFPDFTSEFPDDNEVFNKKPKNNEFSC